MADHTRKLIRQDVATALQNLDDNGTVVAVQRAPGYPADDEADLPGLAVRSGEEAVDEEEGAIGDSHRTYAINVEVAVLADENQDDQLDNILLEAEQALAADRRRNGLALDTRYAGTGAPSYDAEGRPIAYIDVTWEIDYRVPEGDPSA